jgi:hypothetical protein
MDNRPSYPNILAMFERAWEKISQTDGYHRQPKIRLVSAASNTLELRRIGKGKNEGGINVTDGGPYEDNKWYGRIEKKSARFTSNGRLLREKGWSNTLPAFLRSFEVDPVAASKFSAKQTGDCCFCSRTLTDQRSIAEGYGPVCAERYGLTWGAGKVDRTIEVDALANSDGDDQPLHECADDPDFNCV